MLEAVGLEGKAFGGVQEIPLDRVVGSATPEAKAAEFDPRFLPVTPRLRDRWTRIFTAMVEGDELPPIDVYKVDDAYYMIDGHHRVSVARRLGRDMINARVVEVRTRAPLGPNADAAAIAAGGRVLGPPGEHAAAPPAVRSSARVQSAGSL